MIKGIICDLDGAYFVKGKENFIKSITQKYKVKEDYLRTVFLSSDIMLDYKRGKMSDEGYWKEFTRRLNINATKEELVKFLIDGYEQDENVVNLIKDLKSKNLKIIICSNNFPARVDELDRKFNFLQNFTVKVFSYEVGKLKLEGFGMFEEVVNKSNLEKEEILLFDNGTGNIAHAKAFGFAAILYENYPKLIGDLRKFGVSR